MDSGKPSRYWKILHNLASPKQFLSYSIYLIVIFGIIALSFIVTGWMWGIFFAPADFRQGDAYRIIFLHVPSAILAQTIYIAMAIGYVINWVWRIRLAKIFAQESILLGLWMTVIALITGSLWGKPIWGTYWVWDARITSTFVFLLLYVGIYLLQNSIPSHEQATRASSILALIGVVNIPIIKYSVQWWYTLHQGSTFTITKPPSMPIEMWMPLLLGVIGFYALYLFLSLIRMRTGIFLQEARELRYKNKKTY